jgi:two-component system LytT family sensor kinase
LPLPAIIKKPVFSFMIHWMVWIALYFLTYLPALINSTRILWDYVLYNYLIVASINFLLFYLVGFFLLPLIGIKQKRWIWLGIICLVLAVAFCYLKFRVEDYRVAKVISAQRANLPKWYTTKKPSEESLGFFSYRFRTYLQVNIFNSLSIIFIAFAYRLLLSWYMQEKIRKDLETQKLQAELSYLKMQVNPHFLFNALNNIYSLAVSEKGKKTGDSIMKLSELLRYVLYEKEDEHNKVSLYNEIKHINSYIDLMKLRFDGEVYLNFSIEGDPNGKRIAPLLLFPLIENAAKHGILTEEGKPVDIEMKVTDHTLDFSIRNFKNSYLKDLQGGIGIQNVQKRLDLLYGDSYSLKVAETEDKYLVDLQLPL